MYSARVCAFERYDGREFLFVLSRNRFSVFGSGGARPGYASNVLVVPVANAYMRIHAHRNTYTGGATYKYK